MWRAALAFATLAACSLPKLSPLAGDAHGDSTGGSDAVGSSSDAIHHDAPVVPVDSPPGAIVVTGTTVSFSGAAVAGATVNAYAESNPNVIVVSTTSDSTGNFALTLGSAGSSVNDFLEATDPAGDIPSYWWFPATLTAAVSGVTLALWTNIQVQNVSNTCTGGGGNKSLIYSVEVVHAGAPVSGAAISSNPSSSRSTCYELSPGTYSTTLTATNSTGVGLVIGGPLGNITVLATESGDTFLPTMINNQQNNAYVATQVIEQ
jgi:hypothetical protein